MRLPPPLLLLLLLLHTLMLGGVLAVMRLLLVDGTIGVCGGLLWVVHRGERSIWVQAC